MTVRTREEAPAAPEPEAPVKAPVAIPLGMLIWVGLGLLFLAPRFAAVWQLPVGGSEWVHLSGAWNATLGVEDARFVPTLFQALSALLLSIDASETLPRLLAFAATATVPVAVYLMRPVLGEGGALATLLLLALDAPALLLGTSATASGFDVAIAVWMLVLLTRPGLPWWPWPIAAFGAATAGPVPLALVFAAAGLLLLRRQKPNELAAAVSAGAIVLGIGFASFGFGYGWQGVTVPPFVLFARPFEQDWTTAPVSEMALLYSWPLLLGGLAAAALTVRRWASGDVWTRGAVPHEQLLVAWFGIGLLWAVVAANTHSEAPLVAVTLPAAFLAGPWLARGLDALLAVRWPYAWLALGVAFFVFALAAIVIVDWSRWGRVGDGGEVARVLILSIAAVAVLGFLASYRPSRAVVLVPLLVVGAVPLISGTFNAGFGSYPEPLPSPQSPAQAHMLGAIILEILEEQDGHVAVHESLRDEVTWPFRETTTLTIATRVPPDAAVAILPAGHAQPEGMAPIGGQWSLQHHIEQPVRGGFLRHIRWFTDRKRTDVRPVPVDVYVRSDE